MKNKGVVIALAAVLVLVLAGSGLVLGRWGDKFMPPMDVVVDEDETTAKPKESDVPKDEADRAMDFTAYDREGNAVALSDMLGKPVVMNFWASWCPPCREEMPAFEKVYAELGADVQFMMVDMVDGWGETAEEGMEYVDEQGFTFPVYFDTDMDAALTYGVRSIPMTFFIDAEGYIVTSATGAIGEESLRAGIALISE